jgi:hypothetical protein
MHSLHGDGGERESCWSRKGGGQLPRQRPDTPPVELAMHVIDPLDVNFAYMKALLVVLA